MNCPTCGNDANVENREKTGYWRFHRYSLCVICGNPMDIPAVDFNYGSRHDGEKVCVHCCTKYLDDFITKLINDKNDTV